jgi:hypothetical protein
MAQNEHHDPTEFRPLRPEEAALGYDPMSVAGQPVVVWSLVIVLSLIAIFVSVRAYVMYYKEKEYVMKVQEPVAEDAAAQRAREEGALTRYQWSDKSKGLVNLPNDRAMELVLNAYQSGQLTYPGKPVNKAQIDAANSGQAAAAADGGSATTPAPTTGGAPANAPAPAKK